MAKYAPTGKSWGSFYTGSKRPVKQRRSAQGQGSMNAFYSGSSQLVRHSVPISDIFPTIAGGGTPGVLEDGKAIALPLVIFGSGGSANSPTADESSSASIANGSRVNNVQIALQIAQADQSKPNNCYIGFISTSFSDGALTTSGTPSPMTANFADLISMSDPVTGHMALSTDDQDLTMEEYNENPFLKHWLRGFNRYAYTLYSGRPAILKTILPTPPKCRRAQFGMGWWLVMMNDSGALQGVDSGSATSLNFSCNTYFKEIQDLRAEIRTS